MLNYSLISCAVSSTRLVDQAFDRLLCLRTCADVVVEVDDVVRRVDIDCLDSIRCAWSGGFRVGVLRGLWR